MTRISEEFKEAVYTVTKMIPRGRVATYGQVATYVISPRYARHVGWALHVLPESRQTEVPWQRVINASGRISARGEVQRPIVQERLLKQEGIVFSDSGKTDLMMFGWVGPPRDWVPPFPDPNPAKRGFSVLRSG